MKNGWIYFLIFFSWFFSANHGVWSVHQWNTSSWNRYETKSSIFKILCILEQSYCHRFDTLFHDSDFEFFYSHQDCQIDKIQGKNTSSKKYASRGKLWCNIIMQLCLICFHSIRIFSMFHYFIFKWKWEVLLKSECQEIKIFTPFFGNRNSPRTFWLQMDRIAMKGVIV